MNRVLVSKVYCRTRYVALAPLLLTVALGASGCAVGTTPLSSVTDPDSLVTSSVVEKAQPAGIAKTDAEVIKSTVVSSTSSAASVPLAWANPETGSSGAIVAIDNFMGKHGQECRGFKTSVDNFMGIAFYNGEACQISAGTWVLSWFKSSDAQS